MEICDHLCYFFYFFFRTSTLSRGLNFLLIKTYPKTNAAGNLLKLHTEGCTEYQEFVCELQTCDRQRTP